MSNLRVTDPNDFLNSITELVYKEVIKDTSQNPRKSSDQNPFLKMAQVSPNHSGDQRARLLFPGDEEASGKAYPYLSSYTPSANDYVLIAKVHGTWVILGKIK